MDNPLKKSEPLEGLQEVNEGNETEEARPTGPVEERSDQPQPRTELHKKAKFHVSCIQLKLLELEDIAWWGSTNSTSPAVFHMKD